MQLYPGGATVPVDLVFPNPNAVPITIPGATVAVSGNSASGTGCQTSAFTVPQQLVVTPALVVPASSTRSLDQLDSNQSDWPQLQMANSGNQNACKDATVNLNYVNGTAQG